MLGRTSRKDHAVQARELGKAFIEGHQLASRWWKWTSNAKASHRLMSGRNIVLFQELRNALAGQLQTPGAPGSDERELDPLLTDRLCLGRSIGGNDHFRAFRQSEFALQDHDAIVDATMDFHTRILNRLVN
jgi:hypothetical protein